MQDPINLLSKLRRPSLLVRAAHLGLVDYNRERSLRRLLPEGKHGRTAVEAFAYLAEQEAVMDDARQSGQAQYSPARHIELLAAMMVEARLVSRPAA